MKLLFNLEIVEGNRIKARPSDYLKALPAQQQLAEVSEFLQWCEREVRDNTDPAARAEAEIGIATATEFLDMHSRQETRIITANGKDKSDD